jgi:hypothetical protein
MTIRAVNMPVRAYSNSGQPTTLDHLRRAIDWAREREATDVWFNPSFYFNLREGTPIFTRPRWDKGKRWIYSQQGQEKPWATTPSLALLWAAAQYARSLGMGVGWKPMADPEQDGAWRGHASVKGEWSGKTYDNGRRWIWEICAMLDTVSDVVDDSDILCLGTEYYQITKELGGEWIKEVADYVKRHHPKIHQLTYCANWGGWADDSEMVRVGQDVWDELTFRGVSAYFPLMPNDAPPSPTLEELVEGWHRKGIDEEWCPTIFESIYRLAGSTDARNVGFWETGYRADEWAAHDSPGGEPRGAIDLWLQERCWQAFREVWEGAIAGWSVWSVDPFPEDRDARAHCLNVPGREEAARWALAEDPWKV